MAGGGGVIGGDDSATSERADPPSADQESGSADSEMKAPIRSPLRVRGAGSMSRPVSPQLLMYGPRKL